jgi:hypothetical protein
MENISLLKTEVLLRKAYEKSRKLFYLHTIEELEKILEEYNNLSDEVKENVYKEIDTNKRMLNHLKNLK